MNHRLANQQLVRLVATVAAALILAASVGAVTARALTHQPAPHAAICPIPSQTPTPDTPTGRLIALGFHPTEASWLIRQLSGLGFQQRYAAERIAYATEWGGAYAFGPTHYIQPR